MTTPNIVPKFNEEGKVGRPSRRFSEIHGKSVYSDKLILSVPDGQVLPTDSESQVYPSANHIYFDNGRLVQGSETLAWSSEVSELKDIMDALLGDGSDGLSTLSSVVASIQSLDPGEDSFLELVNKINAIEADYATQSDIASLASVTDLSARMTNAEDRLTALEGQDTTVLTTIASQTSRLDSLDALTSTTTSDLSALSSTVTSLDTTVSGNFASLSSDITSAVGRVATLEDNTIPALDSTVSALSTSFNTSVSDNAAAFSTLNSSVATLTTDLDQFNLNRLSDFSTLNTNIGALSTSLTEGLADKLDTSSFSTVLSSEFPALSSTLLSDYATLSSVSSSLSNSLSGYVTDSALSSTLGTYATSTALQQGLDGLDSSIASTLATKADASALSSYVATADLATTLNSQLTETNLGSSGSLSALGAFVTNTAQDSAEFAATTAVDGLTLDNIGTSSSTVDWSNYSFSIGSLLISSVNTFMCADPNIEFNVGQTREYLLEVPGGVSWKRGDEEHDAAILWDEENKLFHVRLAGPETFRLLTVQDLNDVNAEISGLSSSINSNASKLDQNTLAIESNASDLLSYTLSNNARVTQIEVDASELSAALTAQATSTSEALSQLSLEDASLSSAIQTLNTDLASLQALVGSEDTTIRQSIVDLQDALSTVSASLGGEDSTIKLDLDAVRDNVTSLSQEVSDLTQELSNTDALIRSDIGSQIGGLTSSLEGHATQLSDHTGTLSSISENLNSLTESLASEISRVSQLIADGDAVLSASINSLATETQTNVQELTTKTEDLSSLITSNNQEILNLTASSQADLSAVNTALSSSISATNASLDALESSLNASIALERSQTLVDVSEEGARLDASISAASQQLSADLTAHASASNPHNISKSDVGLSNVENVGLTSWTGSTNISTLGTVYSGTWAADPINNIAPNVIEPIHLKSTDDVFTFTNIAVQGQLTVSGDTVQVSTNEVNIGDNIIRLNADVVGVPTENAGIEIERGDTSNVSLLWDESSDRWTIGSSVLEASGVQTSNELVLSGSSVRVSGEAVFENKLSVPHLDITSNMSLNTASSMIALNKDARYPAYPYVGTDANGNSTEDVSLASSFAQDAYDIQGTDADESAQLNNDSGLKVVLGGADNSNEFSYAFLFWDASEAKWRLSESAPTTEETDSSNSVTRTEIVDDSSGAFDILHSGHVGSAGQSSMGNTKIQTYSSDLSDIAALTPNNDDFLVRANGEWASLSVASVKQLVTYDTDDVSEGLNNLYWTEARTRGAITVSGDLSYNEANGTISFTEVGFTGKDTDDLPEGSNNLYYTESRSRASISVSGDLSYNSGTGVISYSTPDGYDSADFSTDFAQKDTDNLSEGDSNLYFTTARARTALSSGGDLSYNNTTGVISYNTPDTDAVTEGSNNLYFTTSRSRSAISAGSDLSYDANTGVISFTQRTDARVKVLASQEIASSSTDDLSEGLSNLYYTEARVRGAVSASGSISYNETTGVFSFTERTDAEIQSIVNLSDTDSLSEGDSNLYFTDARARASISSAGDLSYNSGTGVISYSTPNTDSVSEGDSNLYFTDARARAAVSASGSLSYDSGTGAISFTERTDAEVKSLADEQIGSATTDDVSEGDSNLYFTQARARGSISAGGDLSYDSNTGAVSFTERTDAEVRTLAGLEIAASDSDDISEGTSNLYHSTSRVRSALSAGGDLSYDSNSGTFSFTEVGFTGKDTDDLPEGSNLYFTEARARASISAGSGITLNNGAISVNGDLSSIVTKLSMQDLFQKGSAWDRSTATSGNDTTKSIAFGYTTDGHAGPWRVTRKLSISEGTPYTSVTYRLSDGIDQFKSLPDTNFTLTSSTSGGDTVHSLTLA